MSFDSQEEVSSLLADWAIKEMGFLNSEHKEPTGASINLTGLDLSGYVIFYNYFNKKNNIPFIVVEFV